MVPYCESLLYCIISSQREANITPYDITSTRLTNKIIQVSYQNHFHEYLKVLREETVWSGTSSLYLLFSFTFSVTQIHTLCLSVWPILARFVFHLLIVHHHEYYGVVDDKTYKSDFCLCSRRNIALTYLFMFSY